MQSNNANATKALARLELFLTEQVKGTVKLILKRHFSRKVARSSILCNTNHIPLENWLFSQSKGNRDGLIFQQNGGQSFQYKIENLSEPDDPDLHHRPPRSPHMIVCNFFSCEDIDFVYVPPLLALMVKLSECITTAVDAVN
ncbi:hypothetical protein J6590_040021 [Homalodisca vitripennis]|nr:hypothetical protein J6590_040021 [Homalodisca vitripennis]